VDAEGGDRPGKAKADDCKLSFQSKAGDLCAVANIVHIDTRFCFCKNNKRTIDRTVSAQSKKLCTLGYTPSLRADAAASGY